MWPRRMTLRNGREEPTEVVRSCDELDPRQQTCAVDDESCTATADRTAFTGAPVVSAMPHGQPLCTVEGRRRREGCEGRTNLSEGDNFPLLFMRQYDVSNLCKWCGCEHLLFSPNKKRNIDGYDIMALPCPIITKSLPIVVVAICPEVAIDQQSRLP